MASNALSSDEPSVGTRGGRFLIVFGGGTDDYSMACNFAGSSRFRDDNTAEVEAITSFDITAFLDNGPLLFGWRKVWTREDAAIPDHQFYQVIPEAQLKATVLAFLKREVHRDSVTTPITIVLCCHGHDDGAVQLGCNPRVAQKLFFDNLLPYLDRLASKVVVNIIKCACGSGVWMSSMSNTTHGRVISHAASQANQLAFGHRSVSSKDRSGCFDAAVVNAILASGETLVYLDDVRRNTLAPPIPYPNGSEPAYTLRPVPDSSLPTEQSFFTRLASPQWVTAPVRWASRASRATRATGRLLGYTSRSDNPTFCAIREIFNSYTANCLAQPEYRLHSVCESYIIYNNLTQAKEAELVYTLNTRREMQRSVIAIARRAIETGIIPAAVFSAGMDFITIPDPVYTNLLLLRRFIPILRATHVDKETAFEGEEFLAYHTGRQGENSLLSMDNALPVRIEEFDEKLLAK
ncbi:hypothetical protein TWF696_001760 [Orbilia brochopaga]|uniref:Uncharacterized protein n=1 Tax=Orbilia brochopaga TaxID=3140254 RepID=A0AAV9UA59_9PEZI